MKKLDNNTNDAFVNFAESSIAIEERMKKDLKNEKHCVLVVARREFMAIYTEKMEMFAHNAKASSEEESAIAAVKAAKEAYSEVINKYGVKRAEIIASKERSKINNIQSFNELLLLKVSPKSDNWNLFISRLEATASTDEDRLFVEGINRDPKAYKEL